MDELTRLLRRDPDPASFNRKAYLVGHLQGAHYRRSRVTRTRRLYDRYDFGFGVVTNVGVMALANDALWPGTSPPMNTLATCLSMATGTGVTAAAQTDLFLQTPDTAPSAGGVATLLAPPGLGNKAQQVVATLNYLGAEAVTEWGLLNGGGPGGVTTGTPWTAGTPTTGTVTGTPYTPSGATARGQTQSVFVDTTKAPNIFSLCVANTSSVITVPAWYNVSNGAASSGPPANGDSLRMYPLLLDHMSFAPINVVAGDAIQFSFTLTFPSGG